MSNGMNRRSITASQAANRTASYSAQEMTERHGI